MTTIPTTLKAALQAWLDDATSDEPTDLCKRVGLCSYVSHITQENFRIYDELKALFAQEFDTKRYFPFDDTAGHTYYEDANNHVQHLNPNRIAWVKKQLEN